MIQAQLLQFDERLGHSHWVDFMSRARTLKGLVRQCREKVSAGEAVGYRLHHVYWERIGIVPAPEVSDLRMPASEVE